MPITFFAVNLILENQNLKKFKLKISNMKKLLFIPLLFLLTITANAQIFKVFGHDIGFIYIGPKAGVTYSTISNISDQFGGTSTKSQWGYQFGVVGEFGITSRFSFQTELEFYKRDTKVENSFSSTNIKMNYIGIPLLVKYGFKVLGLSKIYVTGGTFNNVRTGGEIVLKEPAFTQTSPLGSGFRKYDWGLCLGAGAEYERKEGIWGIDLRYNLGMVDLHDEAGDNYKTRSRSFGFALTYKFDMVDMYFKLTKKKKKDSTESEGEKTDSQDNSGLKVDRSKE